MRNLRDIKIYIASAYTKGDEAMNVKFQVDVFNILFDMGFCPIVPLVSHFLHLVNPRPYTDWIEYDNAQLSMYDCCLRFNHIPSSGADGEEEQFKAMNKPVFNNFYQLNLFYGGDIDDKTLLAIENLKFPTEKGTYPEWAKKED